VSIDRIYSWARSTPDKPAAVDNGRIVSYREFARAIDAARETFEPYRLARGRQAVVINDFTSLVDTWARCLALRQLGLNAVVVPAVKAIRALNLPDVACIAPRKLTDRVRLGWGPLFSGIRVLPISRRPDPGRPSPGEAVPETQMESGTQLMYSSGTTGHPKIISFKPSDQQEINQAYISCFQLSADTVFNVTVLTPWTALGARVPQAVWHCGGTVVFDTRENLLANVFDHGVDSAFVAMSWAAPLAETMRRVGPPASHCHLYTGAGLLSARSAALFAGLPNCTTHYGFGATEFIAWALAETLNTHSQEADRWLAPVCGRKTEVVGEDDQPCAPGVEGRLRILLRSYDCEGYAYNPEATRQHFRGGYFYTGDLAVKRSDGSVRILGRSSDVLIVNGDKMAVAPYEAMVQRTLGVDQVAIFSRPTVRGEVELVIAIESIALPEEAKRQQVEQNFGGQFDRISWRAIPSFPRTEGGLRKIRREQLRAMLDARRGHRSGEAETVLSGVNAATARKSV
jgi:acyl-coenzyme A synthetase/AMP-(fatty) acid ligase